MKYKSRKIPKAIAGRFLAKIFKLDRKKIGVYNGVAVRNVGLLENQHIFPDHEKELIEAIRNYVVRGERAIVIGGGSGPSTTVTAQMVGSSGQVDTFEGVKTLCDTILETIELNKVKEIVTVHHAILEKPIYLSGSDENAPILSASDLPDGDVLIMDCEGAELPILKNINKKPLKIIVETHSHLGSSSDEIQEILENKNYKIVSKEIRSKTVNVLVGIRQ